MQKGMHGSISFALASEKHTAIIHIITYERDLHAYHHIQKRPEFVWFRRPEYGPERDLNVVDQQNQRLMGETLSDHERKEVTSLRETVTQKLRILLPRTYLELEGYCLW